MSIKDIISTKLKQPVLIVDSYIEKGDIAGKFFHSGQVYDYRIRKDTLLEYYRNDADTSYVEGYCNARLQQIGIRTDSENPYEYMQGALRMDDQCKTGTACGGICLPPNKKCTLGARLQHAALTAKQNSLNKQEKNLKDRHKVLGKIVDRGLKANIGIGVAGGASIGGVLGHNTHTTTSAESPSDRKEGRSSGQQSLPGSGGTLARSGGGTLARSGGGTLAHSTSQRHTVAGAAAGSAVGAVAGAAAHYSAKSEMGSIQNKLGKIRGKREQLSVKRQKLIDKTPDK